MQKDLNVPRKIFFICDDFHCLFLLSQKNLSIVKLSQQNFKGQKYQVYQ